MPLRILLRLPATTALATAGLSATSLSPDGSTLMYGPDQLEMELWIMEPPVFGSAPEGRS